MSATATYGSHRSTCNITVDSDGGNRWAKRGASEPALLGSDDFDIRLSDISHTRSNPDFVSFVKSLRHKLLWSGIDRRGEGNCLRIFVSSKIGELAVEEPAIHSKLLAFFQDPTATHLFDRNIYGRTCVGERPHDPMDRLRTKVAGFAELKVGWDTYKALPPSAAAIKNTQRFLQVLESLELNPDWVEPSSDDSILLEVTVGGVVQEWDFFSDGKVAVLYEKNGEVIDCLMVEPEVWQMSHHVTSLPKDAG